MRQWFYASRIGTEEAWKSVIDYPDVSELVALRAKQQLVRFYLFHAKAYDKAVKVCDELAATKENNAEFKAFGLAGKCVALSLEEEYSDSDEVWYKYWPLRDSLRDDRMKKEVTLALSRNLENLGPSPAK